MPKLFSRSHRAAVAALLAVNLSTASIPAYAGAATGNATEWTQVLNNNELVGLVGQSAEQIENQVKQITQLAEQIQNQ